MKRKNKKLLLVLLLLICIIGIGYSFLSANLTINGIADIKASTWDVHFDNVKVTEGSVTSTEPTIGTDKLSTSFETTLDEPGDFYEFTIDVVNEGTIDAMIDELNGSITSDVDKYLDYLITYSDGGYVNEGDLLSAGSSETLKLRIEFRKDIDVSDLPTTGAKISMNCSMIYVQADDSAVSRNTCEQELAYGEVASCLEYTIKTKGTHYDSISGSTVTNVDSGPETGDILNVGEYEFTVLSNEDNIIRALGNFNLGNSTFSDTNWVGVFGYTDDNGSIDLTNSNVRPLLDDFANKLDINKKSVTLPTEREIDSGGLEDSQVAASYKYWTRTDSSGYIYVVQTSGSTDYWGCYDGNNGVRPVIIIKE